MNDKTLVERLLKIGNKVGIPCPYGTDGCNVRKFQIWINPTCKDAADTIEAQATHIEALEAALREAPAALNAMAAQVEAEWRDHDKAAARHDLVVQTFRKKVRDALEGSGNG